MVDDDDGDGFPSPEPRTDSRSALPRGFRAWQRLRIVKRDESFSLIFSPRKKIYRVGLEVEELQGAHEVGACPPPLWTGAGPPCLHLLQGFLYFLNRCSVKFQVISRTFVSAHK